MCNLPSDMLVQVDTILASDPSEWPALLFDGLEPPEGALPRGWRQWGACRMARTWLSERSIRVGELAMKVHYDKHLTVIPPSDSARLIAQGALDDGRPLPRTEALEAVKDYVTFFRKGIAAGQWAIELIEQRIRDDLAAGKQPPAALLVTLANNGRSLAQTQAGVVTKGLRFLMEDDDDAMEGFMEADEPRPGPRFGSVRVRTIDGEQRAVRDEGRADRRGYNERAAQEGDRGLPA